jgi:very-short-patch-repair endonuclease
VHVTVPAPDRRRRPGVVVHRGRALAPDEVEAVHGIPTTSPARTLLDLAGAVCLRELEQMIARADRRGLTSRDALLAGVARRPGRPGVRALRTLLREGDGPSLTRSEAEAQLLALLRRGRLPRPEVNVVLGPHEIDLLWRAQRLAVEVDGFAFHAARRAFEDDRRRDGDLAARGYRVVRVTWRQIVDEPEALLVRLAQTLARTTPQ